MRPEHTYYDAIEGYLRTSIVSGRDFLFDPQLFDDELRRLWETYDVPCQARAVTMLVVNYDLCDSCQSYTASHFLAYYYYYYYQSLQSFIRNLHVAHVKKTAPAIKNALPTLVDEYVQGRATIRELAKKCNYSPYLLARFIVEAVTTFRGKKALADAMRDPLHQLGSLDVIHPNYRSSEAVSTSTRLARQVQDAMHFDPMYGPRHDKERHLVGVEYEVVLEYKLNAMSELCVGERCEFEEVVQYL